MLLIRHWQVSYQGDFVGFKLKAVPAMANVMQMMEGAMEDVIQEVAEEQVQEIAKEFIQEGDAEEIQEGVEEQPADASADAGKVWI